MSQNALEFTPPNFDISFVILRLLLLLRSNKDNSKEGDFYHSHVYGILAIRLFTFLADQALAENGKYVFQKIRLDLRVLIITFSKFSFHSFQRCTFRVLQGSDNHSSVDSVSVSFGQEYSFSSQGKI